METLQDKIRAIFYNTLSISSADESLDSAYIDGIDRATNDIAALFQAPIEQPEKVSRLFCPYCGERTIFPIRDGGMTCHTCGMSAQELSYL